MVKIKLFNNQLANLIVKHGHTQVSFSQKIGLSKQGLNYILKGKSNPSPVTAKKICDELGIEFDEIFTTE